MNYKEWRALFSRRFSIPKEHLVRTILRSFTMAEEAVFYFFATIFIVSGLILLWKVSDAYLVKVPIRGGSLTEGIIGNPRFINPVLAISEADKNLTALIYSGLVRILTDGSIENDLAETLNISKDNLTYTVRLDPDAIFHDGVKVTADDVIFTIQKITDPMIKSPRRGSWDGVIVEKIDEETVSFTLKQPYTPFIYNLAVGILPKHIWKNVTGDEFSFSQFNTIPVGSGPYKVGRVERNSGGIPDLYKLIPFDETHNVVFIEDLIFKFYPNEEILIEAYNKHDVESVSGISPEKISEIKVNNSQTISSPLPRVFAIFFNQSRSKALANKEVREALELVSPKKEIVDEILGGFGAVIDSPLPAGIYSWPNQSNESPLLNERMEKAKELLAKGGWRLNEKTGLLEKKSGNAIIPLSFSISTGDAPELRLVAEKLANSWQELGIKINIQVFETGDLNQNVIRPRNFDALLFGEVVGRDADLYPFWHSSQKDDPGLNIALYTNGRADRLLENARSVSDPKKMEENYKAFVEEIKGDVPAVFLYTPSFLYVVPKKVEAINLGPLTVSQDRFLGIRDWYIETDNVWEIFVNKKL